MKCITLSRTYFFCMVSQRSARDSSWDTKFHVVRCFINLMFLLCTTSFSTLLWITHHTACSHPAHIIDLPVWKQEGTFAYDGDSELNSLKWAILLFQSVSIHPLLPPSSTYPSNPCSGNKFFPLASLMSIHVPLTVFSKIIEKGTS